MEKENYKPIEAIIKDELPNNQKEEYFEIGANLIKNGSVAVCFMAGGQGARLGHEGPKGTFVVPFTKYEPKSIFQIQIEMMHKVYQKYAIYPYLFIMTSKENDEATNIFLKENNYFNYSPDKIITFVQGEFPLITEDRNTLFDANGNPIMAANGNGGIFKALEDEGILNILDKNKIEYLVTCNIDNILANPLDEVAIGILKTRQSELGIKTIVKSNPDEKVGNVLLKDNILKIVEYIDFPKDIASKKDKFGHLLFSEAHFGVNYLSLQLLRRISDEKLEIHEAHKSSEKLGKYIKREMFIFDAFSKAKAFSVIRVNREEEFAPIKNKEGQDSPQTAIVLYENIK